MNNKLTNTFPKLNVNKHRKAQYNLILGKKIGMETLLIDNIHKPVTIIDLNEMNILSEHNIVIYGKSKNINKPQKYLISKNRIVTDNDIIIKEELLTFFSIQKELIITGLTKGKGFTGVQKRYDFKCGPASHGASKSHKKGGSFGQDHPAKMLKGTKMPGRHGNKKVTMKGKVLKFENNKLFILGQVPGCNKSMVILCGKKNNNA